MQHLKRDAQFHNAAFFDKMCLQISEIVNQTAAASIPKTFFLAHILFEIALDRVLMEDEIVHLDNFYTELSSVDKTALADYFHKNDNQKGEEFILKLDKFTLSKWLYQYLDDEKLPYSLNRVYFRIGLKDEWKKEQNDALVNMIPQVLSAIRLELPAYLASPLH